MLAAIFALWTVSFYLRTYDPNSSSDHIALRKPHAVQVLCILRLLGVVRTGMAACFRRLGLLPTRGGTDTPEALSPADCQHARQAEPREPPG